MNTTHTHHPLGPILLQRVFHRHHLILIRLLIRIHIDGRIDAHIDARILDRLEDERGLVTVGAVEPNFVGQLGEEVNVARDVGERCAAAIAYRSYYQWRRDGMGEERPTQGAARSAVYTQTRGTNYAAADPC